MFTTRVYSFLFCCTLVAGIFGCSGNPVNPNTANDLSVATSVTQDETSGPTRLNMGYYELTLYPQENKAEIVPVRNVDMHLNVTKIMNHTMGVSVAFVASDSDPAKGIFAVMSLSSIPFPIPSLRDST